MGDDATYVEGYSVSEAARVLDISKNAVRKRVQRESLPATKVDGEWRIFLNDEVIRREMHQDDDDGGESSGADPGPDYAIDVAERQLEAFRDTFVMPLVEAIRELEHENGRLEVEMKHLTELNEQMQRRIEELTAPSHKTSDNGEAVELAWWRRLLGIGA